MPRRNHPKKPRGHKPKGKLRPRGWHRGSGSAQMRQASRWLNEHREAA